MMFEIENPMTIGDYGQIDHPDHSILCPRCGRVWNGYDSDYGTEWESESESYFSAYTHPVSGGMCRCCAWENSTDEQRMQYINQYRMQTDVLDRFLCGSRSGIRRYSNADALWEALTECDDGSVREWFGIVIRDYILDESLDDFVDWLMR